MDPQNKEQSAPEEVLAACYRLFDKNSGIEKIRPICAKIASAMSWIDRSEQVIEHLAEWTRACTDRKYAQEEDRLHRYLGVMHIAGLQELRRGSYYKQTPGGPSYDVQIGRIAAAFNSLLQAIGGRSEDVSPQAKYGEAKLDARLLLGESQTRISDEFKKITAFLKERCCAHVHEYAEGEASLRFNRHEPSDGVGQHDFLDAVQMIAHDKKDPQDIANPPARVRVSLARINTRKRKRRRKMIEIAPREFEEDFQTEAGSDTPRVLPLPPLEGSLIDIKGVQVELDLDRAIVHLGLSSDQATLIDAQMNGLGLQESDAPEVLGWSPKRLERVRRSLEADRKTAKRLRERFAAYASPASDLTN